jgi:hypothetical protein
MTRLGKISFRAYGAGLITFLLAVLFLMVPKDWSPGWVIGMVVTGAALVLEVWWMAANRWRFRHPVYRQPTRSHRSIWADDDPPALDAVGQAAVLDSARREAAGLPPSP